MDKNQNIPLVSIALCTYNGGKFLREQLDSLVNQTYPNMEIIILDDNSHDNTINIIEEYAEKHSFIKYYSNSKNIGYQKNFEKAIQLCDGEFLAISDQDDIWRLNKIETLFKYIGDNTLIYHDSEFINRSGKSMNLKMSDKFNMVSGGDPMPFLFFNCISGHSMMFRKCILEYVFPFPKIGVYDHWIAYMVSLKGNITYIPECLVKHRRHLDNSTHILGKRPKKSKIKHTLSRMERENDWLKICAEAGNHPVSKLANKLYQAGKNRMNNNCNFKFAYLIWINRASLLKIKANKNGLIFSLRYLWGAKFKTTFKKAYSFKF